MEATGDLPPAPDAGADPPSPPPGAAAKPKAKRCLGFAPPPRPAAAATATVPGASNGPAVVPSISIPPATALHAAAPGAVPRATIPRAAAASNRKQRRPPRDTAARRAKRTAPPNCVEPSPAPAVSMEPEASSPTPMANGAQQVLDEMPRSMDNETFMNYTCGDAPEIPSQEYTQEEGEGFVVPTPKKGRGTNFSQKEDEVLCNAWRRIGLDAIVGNDQKISTYWDRIHELYKHLLKGDMARSAGSLEGRFHTISADCFK